MQNQTILGAKERKAQRVLRDLRDLRNELESRLDRHCGGDCEERYPCGTESNYIVDRHEKSRHDSYVLKCPQGRKLWDRMERQWERILKLTKAYPSIA